MRRHQEHVITLDRLDGVLNKRFRPGLEVMPAVPLHGEEHRYRLFRDGTSETSVLLGFVLDDVQVFGAAVHLEKKNPVGSLKLKTAVVEDPILRPEFRVREPSFWRLRFSRLVCPQALRAPCCLLGWQVLQAAQQQGVRVPVAIA